MVLITGSSCHSAARRYQWLSRISPQKCSISVSSFGAGSNSKRTACSSAPVGARSGRKDADTPSAPARMSSSMFQRTASSCLKSSGFSRPLSGKRACRAWPATPTSRGQQPRLSRLNQSLNVVPWAAWCRRGSCRVSGEGPSDRPGPKARASPNRSHGRCPVERSYPQTQLSCPLLPSSFLGQTPAWTRLPRARWRTS